MKKILTGMMAAVLVLVSAGCEKVIEFKGEVTQSRLTISSYAEVGTPLTVFVASSIFFLADQKNGQAFIENLDTVRGSVRCFVNGEQEPHVLALMPEGSYASLCYQATDYVPSPGDHIRLEAEFPGFDPVWAETDVPWRPSFEFISSQWRTVDYGTWAGLFDDETEFHELDITLAVNDDASYHKFYFLQPLAVFKDDWVPDGYLVTFQFSSNDVIFREMVGSNAMSLLDDAGGNYFSDELIKGQRHTFTITISGIYDYEKEMISYLGVMTATASESVYWYDRSFSQTISAMGGLFAEGVTLYSNVNGGYGFFGASYPVLLDIDW